MDNSSPAAPSLAQTYDTALLDLDGVVYVGQQAVPHAVGALEQARALGMRLAYTTNNAYRPPTVVAEHLTELGVVTSAQDVVTSAQAAARLLADRLPADSAVLLVGGLGLAEALREQGLRPVRSLDEQPAAVVQGFAPDVDWGLLAEGAYAVAQGLPWVATNLDLTVPRPRGTAPGNGTLVQVIASTTGVRPEVAGKPMVPMHRETILRTGARRPLVIGDRLDTDIEGAHAGEVDSLLVLTGVTTPADLLAAPVRQRPVYLAEDLRGLLATGAELAVTSAHGGWRVQLTDPADGPVPELRLNGSGTPVQGLRALTAAAWRFVDETGQQPDGAKALAELGW